MSSLQLRDQFGEFAFFGPGSRSFCHTNTLHVQDALSNVPRESLIQHSLMLEPTHILNIIPGM